MSFFEYFKQLDDLAHHPDKALRGWRTYEQSKKNEILARMKRIWGAEFVAAFLEQAEGKSRPEDHTGIVVNDPRITPEVLKGAGYRKVGDSGGTTYWQRGVNGPKAILLPPPKAAPPPLDPPVPVVPGVPPLRPPPKAIHPDIQEVRLYKQEFKEQKDELYRRSQELKRLKQTLPPAEYARLYEQWMNDYDEYQNAVQDKLKNVIPSQGGKLSPDEQIEKAKDVEDLNRTFVNSPGDFFPDKP